jgi:hypothetical protein
LIADVEAMISKAVVVEVDAETAHLAALLGKLRVDRDRFEKEIDKLTEELKLKMGEADTLSYQGQVLCTYKTSKSSQVFDVKRFQAECPGTADKYMLERLGARRFVLKGQ